MEMSEQRSAGGEALQRDAQMSATAENVTVQVVPVKKEIVPKKSRMDPLKMDMSKPALLPATSAQLSLQCLECHIIFSDHKSKERHLKHSHPAEYEQCMLGDALFACYVCDRHFTCSSELMAHQRAHTEKQPFKCPICGDAFRRSSELTLHKKVHFGQHGYSCSDCGKLCKTLTLLKYHRRTHTGERPYVCKDCGKRFSMSKALQKHRFTHTLDEMDGVSQGTSGCSAERKQNKPGISFSCSLCGVIFKSAKIQLQHMKQKHPQEGGEPKETQKYGTLQNMECFTQIETLKDVGNIGQEQVKLLERLEQGNKAVHKCFIEEQGILLPVERLNTEQSHLLHVESRHIFEIQECGGSQNVPVHHSQELIGTIELHQIQVEFNLNEQSEHLGIHLLEDKQTPEHIKNELHHSHGEFVQIDEPGETENQPYEQVKAGDQFQTCKLVSHHATQESVEAPLLLQTTEEPVVEDSLQACEPVKPVNLGDLVQSNVHEEARELECTCDSVMEVAQVVETEVKLAEVEFVSEKVGGKGWMLVQSGMQLGKTDDEAIKKAKPSSCTTQIDCVHTRISTEREESQSEIIKQNTVSVLQSNKETNRHGTPLLIHDQQKETFFVHLATLQEVEPEQQETCLTDARLVERNSSVAYSQQVEKCINGYHQKQLTANVKKSLKETKKRKSRKECLVHFIPLEKRQSNLKRQKARKMHSKDEDECKIKEVNSSDHVHLEENCKNERKRNKAECLEGQVKVHAFSAPVVQFTEVPEKAMRPRNLKQTQTSRRPCQTKVKQCKLQLQEKQEKKNKEKSAQICKKKHKQLLEKKPSVIPRTTEDDKTLASKEKNYEKTRKKSTVTLQGRKQPLLKAQKLAPKKSKTETSSVPLDLAQNPNRRKQTKGQGKLVYTEQKKTIVNHQKPLQKAETQRNQTVVEPKEKTSRKRKASAFGLSDREKESINVNLERNCSDRVETFLDTSIPDVQRPSQSSSIRPKRKVRKRPKNTSFQNLHAVNSNELETSNIVKMQTPGGGIDATSAKKCRTVNCVQATSSHEHRLANSFEEHNYGEPGWDMEEELGEIGLEDRLVGVSFPALNPSPSLPLAMPFLDGLAQSAQGAEACSARLHVDHNTSVHNGECEKNFLPEFKVMRNDESSMIMKCVDESIQREGSHPQENNLQEKAIFITGKSGNLAETTYSDKKVQMEPITHYSSNNTTCSFQNPPSLEIKTFKKKIKEELLSGINFVSVGDYSIEHCTKDETTRHPQDTWQHITKSVTDNVSIIEEVASTLSSDVSLDTRTMNHSQIKREDEEIDMEGKTSKDIERGRIIFLDQSNGHKRLKGTPGLKKSDEDGCKVVMEVQSVIDKCSVKGETQEDVPLSSHKVNERETTKQQEYQGEEVILQKDSPESSLPASLEGSGDEQIVLELESVTTSVEVLKMEETEILTQGNQHGKTAVGNAGNLMDNIHVEFHIGERSNQAGGIMFLEAIKGQVVKMEDFTSERCSVASPGEERGLLTSSEHLTGVHMIVVKEEDSDILHNPQAFQRMDSITTKASCLGVCDNRNNSSGNECCMAESPGLILDGQVGNECILLEVKEEEKEVEVSLSQKENAISVVWLSGMPRMFSQVDPAKTGVTHQHASSKSENCETILIGTEKSICIQKEKKNIQQHPELLFQSLDVQNWDGRGDLDEESFVCACYDEGQSCPSTTATDSEETDLINYLPQVLRKHEETGISERNKSTPIEYFSEYLDYDFWEVIVSCNPMLAGSSNPLTVKELARFVGIHIAMGTLKFPDLELYWQALTRVPLIADAMPASRFHQLANELKLTCQPKDTEDTFVCNVLLSEVNEAISGDRTTLLLNENIHSEETGNYKVLSDATGAGQIDGMLNFRKTDGTFTDLSGKEPTQKVSNIDSTSSLRIKDASKASSSTTDPLWIVRALIDRVRRGCLSLKRVGNLAVDQYTLHLGHMRRRKSGSMSCPALNCAVLIGSGGLILDLTVNLGDSSSDVVVEMVSRNKGKDLGAVFLCKEELANSDMLEKLLLAGVRSAAKVDGVRLGFGDEFVSSDGKFTLFRCRQGFVLSTLNKQHSQQLSVVEDLECARNVARLNQQMLNLYRTPLSASPPPCWPQSVLWHLTDLALVNSWLQYRQDHQYMENPMKLMTFRLEVAKALIYPSGNDIPNAACPKHPVPEVSQHEPSHSTVSSTLSAAPSPDATSQYDGLGHWPEQLSEGEGGKCKFGGCNQISRVRCLKCCVFLCISRSNNCFLKFHCRENS